MSSLVTIIIFGVGLIFTSGGLYVMLKNALKRLSIHEDRINEHEIHFGRHDVVFEKIIVGQEYIMRQLEEQKERMIRFDDKLDKRG